MKLKRNFWVREQKFTQFTNKMEKKKKTREINAYQKQRGKCGANKETKTNLKAISQ